MQFITDSFYAMLKSHSQYTIPSKPITNIHHNGTLNRDPGTGTGTRAVPSHLVAAGVIRFETFAATFSQKLIDLYFDIFGIDGEKTDYHDAGIVPDGGGGGETR